MSFKEKLLLHQIHPLKISVDVVSALASVVLYWHHFFWIGLGVNILPPLIASAVALFAIDLDYLRTTMIGRHVQEHMTTGLEWIRFVTNFLMLSAAWYHSLILVICSAVVIVGCWCWGIILNILSKSGSSRSNAAP